MGESLTSLKFACKDAYETLSHVPATIITAPLHQFMITHTPISTQTEERKLS